MYLGLTVYIFAGYLLHVCAMKILHGVEATVR